MSQAKEHRVANIVSEPPTDTKPSGNNSGPRNLQSTIYNLQSSLAGWGGGEWRRWRRAFDGPAPFALLLVGLLALLLAWQVPFSYRIDTSTELNLDQPFLHNFNTIENTEAKNKGDWFRWSKGEGSFEFQGIGRRPYRFQINLSADLNPNKQYTLFANSLKIAEGQVTPGIKTYTFEIPASAISYKDGNLWLFFKMQGFSPQDVTKGSTDQRELGFAFFSAKLDPVGSDLVAPPLNEVGLLLGVIMLAYLVLARAGFTAWRSAGAAAGLAIIPVYVVASPGARIWLTIYYTQVAFAFGWALIMLVLLDIPMRRVWTVAWEQRWVLGIFGLALALRLVGILHPQAQYNPGGLQPIADLGFHENRFSALWDRGLWWDKIVSAEWGGRPTYYPLTSHFLIGLFQWLISDRRSLILVSTATLECTRILLIFYLVKKVTGDGRSAVIAAFLVAALPVNLLSLAWGQVANLFGEWFILAALCITVVKWEQLRRPGYFIILTITLWASFIMHPGEVILSGIVFGGAGVFFWLRRDTRSHAKIFLLSYGLAIVLAFASYHWVTVQDMIPQALSSLDSRTKGQGSGTGYQIGWRTGGSVSDRRLGFVIMRDIPTVSEMLYQGALGFWREIRIYFDVFPILLFPIGLWWLRRKDKGERMKDEKPDSSFILHPASLRLFWFGVAWTVTGILFAIVGLVVNLYVRYSLFMLPFVAIGAAIFLGRLWKRQEEMGRGWAAALLTCALLAWIALSSLALYYDRMIYLYHGP